MALVNLGTSGELRFDIDGIEEELVKTGFRETQRTFLEFRNELERLVAPLEGLDHGNLLASSLLDDDHTQYSLVDGTRAYTGDVTVGDGGASSGAREVILNSQSNLGAHTVYQTAGTEFWRAGIDETQQYVIQNGLDKVVTIAAGARPDLSRLLSQGPSLPPSQRATLIQEPSRMRGSPRAALRSMRARLTMMLLRISSQRST